jgi:hypothetical protein
MEWSEVNIDRCPVCGNDWKNIIDPYSYCLGKGCRTSFSRLCRKTDIWRHIEEYVIVWVISDKITEVYNHGRRILKVSSVIPLDITKEKLKTYILFG